MKNKLFLIITFTFIISIFSYLFIGCSKTSEKINIGVISPFSGDGAIYGEHLKNGFEIALEDIKKNYPDVYDRMNIIYEDDKLNSSTAVSAYKKLVDVDKVKIIVGAFTSNTTLAITPFTSQDSIILITPTATNYRIKYAGDFVYRICPSDAQQGKILAEYAINNLDSKTASILFMNTDYGEGLRENFVMSFEKLGGKILSSDGFPQNETNFRAQLTKIKRLNPDVIFLPSNWKEAANAVNQARQYKVTNQIICTDGTFEQDFLNLTKGASEGIVITSFSWGEGDAVSIANHFKEKFNEKFGKEPNGYSALCFDALMVVGKLISISNYNTVDLKTALDTIQYNGATGLTKFDEFGEVDKSFGIFIVENNQFIRIE